MFKDTFMVYLMIMSVALMMQHEFVVFISEQQAWKDKQESGHGLIWGTITWVSLKDWRKTTKNLTQYIKFLD